MDWGENIKAAREAKGMTQEELGKKIGVTGVTIMRYEKNQRKPNLDILFQLSDVLGVSAVALAGVEEIPPASIEELERQYDSLDQATKVNSMFPGLSDEDREKVINFIEKLSHKDSDRPWVKASEFEMHRMGILQFESDEDRTAFFYSHLNTDGMLMAGKYFFKHLKPEDMKEVADYIEQLAETPQYQRAEEPDENKK